MFEKFSVLLSVYYKEDINFFIQAFNSIIKQTLQPNEIILLKDGALTTELDSIIAEYKILYPNLKVISLLENQGLGKALNEGLKYCTNDLIARMDTDDISLSTRFEKQVHFMKTHPEIDVCSAWIDEFIDSPNNII